MSDRVYRPVEPSDLPKIQEGKLKAFRRNILTTSTQYFPARLVSVNYRPIDRGDFGAAFMVDFADSRGEVLCCSGIFVDVTPEVRWIIWNLKYNRISGYMNDNKAGWSARGDAERFLQAKLERSHTVPMRAPKAAQYKIVSFEV